LFTNLRAKTEGLSFAQIPLIDYYTLKNETNPMALGDVTVKMRRWWWVL